MVGVKVAVAVVEHQHRGLEAGDVERSAHGLAHEVLRILERRQPRDRAGQPLRRRHVDLRAAELFDPA